METVKNRHLIVTGSFNNREEMERAYNKLEELGYTKDEIDVIMTDETRKKHFIKGETKIGNKALEGTGAGAVIGGSVGAVAAIIAAIGTSLVIPGLGLVVAGPLAAAIAGAGAGAASGGLIGALVGAGLTEERARVYEKDLKSGKIVLNVHVHNEEEAKIIEANWNAIKTEEVYH
jgi:uncharacterized membrane protein